MEKTNQPLIITSIVVGAVLIIALALIFTRGDDDTTTETVDENNTSENQNTENTEENGSNGQQPAPASQPAPQPAPVPEPIPVPTPTPTPQPQPDGLPSDWNSLTPQQKTNLNPFNCDIETQIIYADDGTCHDKTSGENEGQIETPVYRIDTPFVVEFNNGLRLKTTLSFQCSLIQDRVASSRTQHRKGVMTREFLAYLQDKGFIAGTETTISAKTFAMYADLYQTNLCRLSEDFENVGDNYAYPPDTFPPVCHPIVTTPNSQLIDKEGNRYERRSRLDSSGSMLVDCVEDFERQPYIFEKGDMVEFPYSYSWLLPADVTVEQLRLVFDGDLFRAGGVSPRVIDVILP